MNVNAEDGKWMAKTRMKRREPAGFKLERIDNGRTSAEKLFSARNPNKTSKDIERAIAAHKGGSS